MKENHRNGASGLEGMEGSYKAKLLGEIPGAYEQAFEFDQEMDTSVESDDDMSHLSRGMKAISVSKETKVHICVQWSSVLIVKVFGKTMGYQFLHPQLLNMWRLVGKLDCVSLGKYFFLVRFSLKEDYVNVLKGGPWFVSSHYLSIRSCGARLLTIFYKSLLSGCMGLASRTTYRVLRTICTLRNRRSHRSDSKS